MTGIIRICLILTLTLGSIGFPDVRANTAPLLMQGKKSLYQRVLSVPDARLFPRPSYSGRRGDRCPCGSRRRYEDCHADPR